MYVGIVCILLRKEKDIVNNPCQPAGQQKLKRSQSDYNGLATQVFLCTWVGYYYYPPRIIISYYMTSAIGVGSSNARISGTCFLCHKQADMFVLVHKIDRVNFGSVQQYRNEAKIVCLIVIDTMTTMMIAIAASNA